MAFETNLLEWKEATNRVGELGQLQGYNGVWIGDGVLKKILVKEDHNPRWSISPCFKENVESFRRIGVDVFVVYGVKLFIGGPMEVGIDYPSSIERRWSDLESQVKYPLPKAVNRGRFYPWGKHLELPESPGLNWYFIDGPSGEVWEDELDEVRRKVEPLLGDLERKLNKVMDYLGLND